MSIFEQQTSQLGQKHPPSYRASNSIKTGAMENIKHSIKNTCFLTAESTVNTTPEP
ncbi:hypothetical protein [Brevibacillus agri]|uniref:hypothetical protein n=1 Tax=Brevibacillus agri TaxID=51101 RepID=UPI0018CFC1D9|nr:hypothetical protein [Brevibacillus agri]